MATTTLNPIRTAPPAMLLKRAGLVLWMIALAVVLAMHLVHLRADFPNHSQWVDWAKYTDEGWYANAAIRHQLTGSWYLQGDFNPAVVLPVWPVLAGLLFQFTGVSLLALRSLTCVVFAIDLGLVYVLLREAVAANGRAPRERWLMPLLGVTLGATSAFLCAFTRIAILEPLLILWFLLGLWLAGRINAASSPRQRVLLSLGLGLVVWLMMLTKTTGICVLPALAWMLWPQRGVAHRARQVAVTVTITAGSALLLGGLYYILLVQPRYTADFHYFFTANAWDHPKSLSLWLRSAWYTVHGALWAGRLLPGVAAAVCLLTIGPLRALLRSRLFGAGMLSCAGVLLFIWWHNNSQARYYTVMVPGLIFVAVLGCDALLRRPRWRPAGWAVATALSAACLSGGWQIAQTAMHPEYTYLSAAQSLARFIAEHPQGNPTVLSVSSDQLRLMTGIPAICDDFGTEPLVDRIARYQPGWFASWNDVDGGTLEDIHTRYRLVREASFSALDDEDRDQLILYRMMPLPGPDEGVDVDNTP